MCIVFNLLLIFLRSRIEKRRQRAFIDTLFAELWLDFLKLRSGYLVWKGIQVNIFHNWNLEDTVLK